MRVLLATVGSTGDMNPFLALGGALRGAGHEPVVFTSRSSAPMVARAGLGFCDSHSPASDAGYESMLRAVMSETNPLKPTAAAFRAGIPQVVVWHMGDQTFWGARVAALGVGPKTLYHRKLTARRLAERIDRVFRDAAMTTAARELGARVRAEDGVDGAVRAIEGVG